jgi:predicted dehydrogenase
VVAEGSWFMADSHGFKMEYTVNFEKATADFDSSRGADALQLHEDGQKSRSIQCGTDDGYILELRHIVESIQNGVAPTIVTAKDGLSAVEICAAEERSVKTGTVVAL